MNNTIKIEKKKRFSKKSIKDIFIKIYDLLSDDDFLGTLTVLKQQNRINH